MSSEQKWKYSVAAPLPILDVGTASLADFLTNRADDIESIDYLNKISNGFDQLYEKAVEGWEQEISGQPPTLDSVNAQVIADKLAPIVIREKFFLAKSLYVEDLRMLIDSLSRKIYRREQLMDELIAEVSFLTVFTANARLAAIYHVLTVKELHEIIPYSNQARVSVPQYLETYVQQPSFKERYRNAVVMFVREKLIQQVQGATNNDKPAIDRTVLQSRSACNELFEQHCMQHLQQTLAKLQKHQTQLRSELQQLNEQRAIRSQEHSMAQSVELIPQHQRQ